MSGQFEKLLRSTDAAVAMQFVIILFSIVTLTGGTLDVFRVEQIRRNLQNAMDTAVISGFVGSTTPNNTYSTNVFNTNFSDPAVTLSGLTFTNPTTTSITGTVKASIKSMFLGLVGVGTFDIGVTSTAVANQTVGITSVKASTSSAQGAFSKEIYFFTKDASGTILTKQLLLQYTYCYCNGAGTKTYSPAIGSSITATISAYQTYGLAMVVYQDLTYKGAKTNPVTYYSDASNAWTFIHTAGTCSTTETDNWEDGGDSNFVDFVYTLKCTTGPSGPLTVRLSN